MFHKALMDKKSSATLAKLARQAGNMYSEVSSLFNTPSLVQHFERSWVAHTQMKVRGQHGFTCACSDVDDCHGECMKRTPTPGHYRHSCCGVCLLMTLIGLHHNTNQTPPHTLL